MEMLRKRWRAVLGRWLNRRIPRAREVRLDQRRIFILPTTFGALYLLMTLLTFLVGVNYRNSIAYALSFLLLSLFLVAILETYRNLSGLTLRAHRSGEGFVGEEVGFELQLAGQRHRALELGWSTGPQVMSDLDSSGIVVVRLFHPARHRGKLVPGRFRVSSQYPLGLLEAWSLIDLSFSGLAFPKPITFPLPVQSWSSGVGGGPQVSGLDDFVGLKRYQPGDALSQIAWKKQAKGGQLLSKHFSAEAEARLWFCWQQTQGSQELRLSQLCHWVLEAERRQLAYGLRLPGLELPQGLGVKQQQRCLSALALYAGGAQP